MRMAANGSGWSQYYDCILYKISLDSFSKFILPRYPTFQHAFLQQKQHHGFVITLETIDIRNPLYVDDRFFVCSPTPAFIFHLPPASLSSHEHVADVVDIILSKCGVPATDPNTLVQHLLKMGRLYEQTSASTLVPLLFDFNVTTVLRNPTEYADWMYGGTMNSVILRTLRATEQSISNLEKKISLDDELSDSSNCTICLEGFEEGSVSRLPCSHEFHHTCIVEWLRCNNRCPVCRFSMPWVRSVVIADEDNVSLPLENRLSSRCYSFSKRNYNLLGSFCNKTVSLI